MPLSNGPGQMNLYDLLGDLPKTDRGNRFILLVADLFHRHEEAYAMSSAETISKGCASRLVNDYLPRWYCPHAFLSDQGPACVSQVAQEVYAMLGVVRRYTSSLHPRTNGMAERLNHTLLQMLSY